MERRTFLLAPAVLLAASACAPPRGVTYWNLFTGSDGSRMTEMVNSIDVQVEPVTLTWGEPYYTKLAMAAAGGRAPDLAILHLSRLTSFAGLLDPFDDAMLAANGLTADRFPSGLWSRTSNAGRTYAVPLDTHPLVLFYNTEICGKAGLLDNGRLKPLRGERDLLTAFQRAKQVTGRLGVALAGIHDVNPWRLFWTLYRQQGGDLRPGDRPLDDAKALRTLRFLREVSEQSQFTDYAAAVALFSNGAAGFYWNGEWELATFTEQGLPFDVAPFPQIYDRRGIWADSHSFVLPHQHDRDPERTRRTVEAVSALVRKSLTWSKGGHIPAYLPVANSPDYHSNYRSAADEVELDPPLWFAGTASDMQTTAGAIFGAVMSGAASPESALGDFTSAFRHLANTPRPA
ncbi:MAG: extracellular solute-binding protein [Kutzneria sp.]|nr:extracellular solute-binding protein [Kutzneria sp.]MBV9847287.1 extracellular solute-binding protein [Kutzneria sp.]